LNDRQTRELAEFRKRYREPAVLKRFSRPSRELLSLRRAERKLALTKEYEEARRTKALADALQRREEAQMRLLLEREIEVEFQKLTDAHRVQRQNLAAYEQRLRADLETQRAREIRPLESSMRQIALKKNEPANRKLMAMQLISSAPYGRLDDGTRSCTLPTPRTQQKMQDYRGGKLVEMAVKPVSDAAFDRLQQREKRGKLPKLTNQ
jgi:hypothetical protein